MPSGGQHHGGIEPRFESQGAYGPGASYYGEGKYPPDWDARREVVWDRQDYCCARCGRYKGDVRTAAVHHVVHLADGGGNSLDNLVGLCGDCHALMHPDVADIDGNYAAAPLFPAADADPLVSVVRLPSDDEALATDLRRLAADRSPDRNRYAVTSVTVPTSSEVARRAESDLHDLLLDAGYVPRTSPYHRVQVVPKHLGVRGLLSQFRPSVEASPRGRLAEWQWADGNEYCDVFVTPDAEGVSISVTDGTGERTERSIRLDHPDGERLRLELPASPPPLTIRTAPRYVAGAVWNLGVIPLLVGLLPVLLARLLVPGLVPDGGGLLGLVVLAVLAGLVVWLPILARRYESSPEERLVDDQADERAEGG